MIYIVVLILLALIVAWFASNKTKRKGEGQVEEEAVAVPDDCCGAHEVCEADSLLSSSAEVNYYDDEELDRFRGTAPSAYSDDAIEEFRDILYTLKGIEVASWMKSIQLRQIELPEIIREEALLIVGERRNLV
ncbi:hypothetical protein [Plebeiibacterium marinum]|uniref:Phospholipase n=1 Tax=Plebeiibacterium marinum TaxID=2992111 RepID=A0AAE3SKT6_9BACT|nr:hypothetical protein [Plebeiobacterium marinum]MCW3806739.1 hypothetical protein [Plebeiobacterium marinum]